MYTLENSNRKAAKTVHERVSRALCVVYVQGECVFLGSSIYTDADSKPLFEKKDILITHLLLHIVLFTVLSEYRWRAVRFWETCTKK